MTPPDAARTDTAARATDFPSSTYRLHLTGEFTLEDAAGLVEHVDDLGIDWMYASPIQTVPPGATHGYHILDPDEVNPELGGEEALRTLHERLAERGLGLVLDIVPNHLAASTDNAWWEDVLRHGRGSQYADVFDIDFDAGPIVLPVLGEPLEEALTDGLHLVDGRLEYHGLSLPLAPGTDPDADIADQLAAQHYRLMPWQEGEAALNWRRFFAVNDLVGVRVEDPAVFEQLHTAIFRWLDADLVQGLRVDHIDGLADPGDYLTQLRRRIGAQRWLVVEKIVEPEEPLPASWPVEGTTGYEVGTLIQAWLTDAGGYQRLRTAFADATDGAIGDSAVAALPASKLAALDALFPAEVGRVVQLLGDVPGAPDRDVLQQGVRHLTAHLSGYRTYAGPEGELSTEDVTALVAAADRATAQDAPEAAVVADLLRRPEGRPALVRWQQLTGPAAAKGFEDRLLFRYVPLSGVCEVGSDAALLDGLPDLATIRQGLTDRAATTPAAGTTTSTHDTKRSEDVRARLAVLAECPDRFVQLFDRVGTLLEDAAEVDAHSRWLLLQAVVGTLGMEQQSEPRPEEYRQRLQGHAGKVLREAELHTSHRQPDAAYEGRVSAWLDALLQPGTAMDAVRSFVDGIAIAGACTSLSQQLLKIAGPGVPDVYRGTEVWDSSLTDPDNRRPLDVERLTTLREGLAGASAEEVRDRWRDGALKMLVTRQAMHARRAHPEVFMSTLCSAPEAVGDKADHVAALLRTATDEGPAGTAEPGPAFLALTTRLPLQLAGGSWPLGPVWGDTEITVPPGTTRAIDVLTGRPLDITDRAVRMADATATLPLALLELR